MPRKKKAPQKSPKEAYEQAHKQLTSIEANTPEAKRTQANLLGQLRKAYAAIS